MAKPLKFAVVLSGCGFMDGSEVYEATYTLLAIERNGCVFEVFAPDKNQMHVINHHSGKETGESRNVLVESARIVRGKISKLDLFDAGSYDVLIFPGGFGGAKNLSDYAVKGSDITVDPGVVKAVVDMHKLGKPIGALCITPVFIAKILGDVEVTIGSEEPVIQDIQQFGGRHFKTNPGGVHCDDNNKIVTAPCFMLDAKLTDIADETDKVVKQLIKLAGQS